MPLANLGNEVNDEIFFLDLDCYLVVFVGRYRHFIFSLVLSYCYFVFVYAINVLRRHITSISF